MTLETRNAADRPLIALSLDDPGSVQPAPDGRYLPASHGTAGEPSTAGTQIEACPTG